MKRGRTRAVIALSSIGILAVAVVGALSGIAAAVSGGGYNPNQQDCPWNADSSGAPSTPTATDPGCHNLAVNVESGGTTNGDPNSTNTRYAEFGNDQSPQMNGNPGFGLVYNAGDPGTYDSPHSGCLAVNTDGTGGGTGAGCGNNPSGTGFDLSYDYYQLYCPLVGMTPLPAAKPGHDTVPNGLPMIYACASDQPVGKTTFTPDTGSQNSLSTILTHGLLVYFGMDDNTDNGEHDGFSGVPAGCPTGAAGGSYSDTNPAPCTDGGINGSSDGGAMVLSIEPQWLMTPSTPTATHPEGVLNYSEGECADGICGGITTQQQTEYYGCVDNGNPATAGWTANGVDGATNPQNNQADDQCGAGTPGSEPVFENGAPASTQEQGACQSGNTDNGGNACFTNVNKSSNPGGVNAYRAGTPQQMNTDPGIQTYQDPDPQRSPAAPFATPGAYAGTCGVYLNDSGGYGSPGLSQLLTGGNVTLDPGWVVGPTDPSC